MNVFSAKNCSLVSSKSNSDCLHSLPVLGCMSLAFSVILHYFPSNLFIHIVTPHDSTFSSYDNFPLYVFSSYFLHCVTLL